MNFARTRWGSKAHISKCSPGRLSRRLAVISRATVIVVSFATVIRVVTQRLSHTSGGLALRDDPYNGGEGDYCNR